LNLNKLQKQIKAIVTGIVFILAGINHFVMPAFYLQIVPAYLPFPMLLIYLSGFAEIACGSLLIPQKSRKIGAWLTIALLIAVFPANVQMVFNEFEKGGLLFYAAIARLPFQFLMIWWVYRFTR
jgi:uncharacterized membrane protein